MKTLSIFVARLAFAGARADVAADLLNQLKSELKAEAKVAREKGEDATVTGRAFRVAHRRPSPRRR